MCPEAMNPGARWFQNLQAVWGPPNPAGACNTRVPAAPRRSAGLLEPPCLLVGGHPCGSFRFRLFGEPTLNAFDLLESLSMASLACISRMAKGPPGLKGYWLAYNT